MANLRKRNSLEYETAIGYLKKMNPAFFDAEGEAFSQIIWDAIKEEVKIKNPVTLVSLIASIQTLMHQFSSATIKALRTGRLNLENEIEDAITAKQVFIRDYSSPQEPT